MLQQIQENINRLIEAFENERSKSGSLAAQLETMRKELDEEKNKNKLLEEKVRSLTVKSACAVPQKDTEDCQAVKERIDGLIKKIDLCLEMLK